MSYVTKEFFKSRPYIIYREVSGKNRKSLSAIVGFALVWNLIYLTGVKQQLIVLKNKLMFFVLLSVFHRKDYNHFQIYLEYVGYIVRLRWSNIFKVWSLQENENKKKTKQGYDWFSSLKFYLTQRITHYLWLSKAEGTREEPSNLLLEINQAISKLFGELENM